MAGHAPVPASPGESSIRELPPSAKLVVKTLEYEGSLTQAELAESTRLPDRTVRYALRKLEAADLVSSRISFVDARQRIYSIPTDES
ncbi:winged helix-turn-helix domain-containing protein [Haloplanus litoreus]|uniref:Winged helix-turn-helix domain-containing protein n=1 Tax=Haloplanus litoreus TaxID=767515 RepID=A0ABD5ZY28_9EURY